MSEPVLIRPATEADLPLIFSSWIRSYRHGNPATLRQGRSYAESQHRIVERLLARAEVRVACYSGSPSLILGWACIERKNSTIHYCYVKNAYRGLGLVRSLLGSLLGQPLRYSHRTRKLRPREGWTYHPEDKE